MGLFDSIFPEHTWFGRTIRNPTTLVTGAMFGPGAGLALGGAQSLGDMNAEARVRNVGASGPDLSGYPSFRGGVDQEGRLLPQYQLGNRPYQQSPWASMMKQQAGVQRMAESDALADQGASAAAQARTGLAMRGGLTSGASERLGSSIAKEQMLGNQRLAQANMFANLNIGAQDYQNQQASDRFNIMNSLGALQNQNNYNMDLWKTQMQQQGLNTLARAQAGQKNGLFGLGFLGL